MQVFELERPWISRPEDSVPTPKTGPESPEDCVYSAILVERSTDLLALDPGGRLRIACAAALDGLALSQRIDLIEFADGMTRGRAIPLGESAAPYLQQSIDQFTDYLGAAVPTDASLYSDVTNFVVLLCAPEVHVCDELLEVSPPSDPRLEDPHWRDVPITDPHLMRAPRAVHCDACGERTHESSYGELLPRADTCVVVASIGGEPSPRLRHYAEITGGAAVAIRSEEDAALLAVACEERHVAVVGAIERRFAEHEEWVAQNAGLLERLAAHAEHPPAVHGEPAVEGVAAGVSDIGDLRGETDDSDEDAELDPAVQALLEAWEEREPVPTDFVDVAIYLERSVAAIGADPGATLRVHAVDALDRHEFGIGQQLYSYGQGLIAEGLSVINQRMGGYARELMERSRDHTRVDLPAAIRQGERCSGPQLLAVLGTALAEIPEVLSAGVDAICPGTEPDDPVNHRPPEPYAGDYGEAVVFGLLGGEPSPELRARCEATGGIALAIRSFADVHAFAEACAAVYRDLVETVEADCASGALDLGRVYGG